MLVMKEAEHTREGNKLESRLGFYNISLCSQIYTNNILFQFFSFFLIGRRFGKTFGVFFIFLIKRLQSESSSLWKFCILCWN
ncbi:unnamed protein product [Prunus armeniaca]